MGCRVGRRRLECGILEVMPQTDNLIPEGLRLREAEVNLWADDQIKAQLSKGALFSHASLGRFQQDDLYSELIKCMNELFRSAHRKSKHIASIGIAVPGGVYPDQGHFDGLVVGGPFNPGEDITGEVARRLVQQVDHDVLTDVLGTRDPKAMRDLIHLDNDARCATRWYLVENPTWQNMACVFAGTGVGSGLVFGHEVFYGNRFRAGEIGHVNLNPGSLFLLDRTGDRALQPRHCSCGIEGYHFESLAGIGGLGHLAEVINGKNLAELYNTYMADPDRRKQIEAETLGDDDAKGMITLRALAYVGQPNPVFAPYIKPNEAFLKLIHNRLINDYLENVSTTYARLFGAGIAALLAALDLEHVVLCGTIPEFLHYHPRFIKDVEHSLSENIPGEPTANVPIHHGEMRHSSWRGAALLSNDLGYMRRRFP
jgi:predicted NBD/HSP70 family sugar kinase